jgi:hypothetical protein
VEQIALAVALRQGGAKIREIAEATGIKSPYRFVSKVAKPTQPSERDLKIAAAYAAGRTMEEVGAEFEMCRERVRQIVKRIHGRSIAAQASFERQRLERLNAQPTIKFARNSVFSRKVYVWLRAEGYSYCSYGHHVVCVEECLPYHSNLCGPCNAKRGRERNRRLHPEWSERTPEQRENIKRGLALGKAGLLPEKRKVTPEEMSAVRREQWLRRDPQERAGALQRAIAARWRKATSAPAAPDPSE